MCMVPKAHGRKDRWSATTPTRAASNWGKGTEGGEKPGDSGTDTDREKREERTTVQKEESQWKPVECYIKCFGTSG